MQIYSNHRYKCNIIYRHTCKMRINVRFAMIHHCFAGEAVRLLAAFLQMTCEFAQVQDSVTFLFSPEGRRLVSCTYALDNLTISHHLKHHFATKFCLKFWKCTAPQLGAEGAEAGVASTSVFTRPNRLNHCYSCYSCSCYSYCRYLAWDYMGLRLVLLLEFGILERSQELFLGRHNPVAEAKGTMLSETKCEWFKGTHMKKLPRSW